MTITRRLLLTFVFFSTFLTLHAQPLGPLSIRQPFEALSKAENQMLLRIDTFFSKNEWQAPIRFLDSTFDEQLPMLIQRLSALDTTQPRIALPLAIARVFKADDLALYQDFKESIRLCELTISALKTHARDSCSLYALAMAHDIKAYDLEFLFDLEEGLLERDKAIEALKRIGLEAHVISERLNKSRVYADLGDEKAGLKELEDFDRAKSNYNFSAFYKQEIFATTVRSMLLIRKAMKQQSFGELDSAKLTFQTTLDSLNQAIKQLNDNKKMLDINEFMAAQRMIQITIATVYSAGRCFSNQGDSILAHVALAETLGQGQFFQDNILKASGFIFKKDFDNAKKNLQSVFHDLVDGQTDTANIFSTPPVNVRNVPYLQLLPQIYYVKNRLLTALYDDSKARNKADLNYLKHGFICAQNALSSIDSLRINFSTDATMQNVVKAYSDLYAPTVLTAGRLYQETNNSAYLDTMLRISEQYKTFILRQTVYTRTNRERYTGETRRLYEQEAELKRNLIGTQNAFGNTPTPETLQKRDVAHTNYRQFKENLKKMPPNTEGGRYYAERFADSVPTIKDIQRDWLATKKGEVPRVFLSFTVSGTHIVALLVTTDKAKPYIKETKPEFWQLLKRFNASITSDSVNFPTAAAFYLYQTLLEDILKDVPRDAHLIISAEGLLLRTPFEALLTQVAGSDDQNYPKMNFLIKKHRISYVPSFTTQMWLRIFHQAAPQGKNTKIGIVKGDYSTDNYPAINSLLKVADNVATLYGASAAVFDQKGNSFLTDEKKELDVNDLFFAVHGEASAENPLNYALILRDGLPKKSTDVLTVAKIQRLTFKKLNLAVFGACQTQSGELDLGEGVFSIARAFQGLGCRHIVATLNSVRPKPTADLLDAFFSSYKGRPSISSALHEAKLGYLKTHRYEQCHPHFWANIIYMGDE